MEIETLHKIRGGNIIRDKRFTQQNKAPEIREILAEALSLGANTKEIVQTIGVSGGTLSKALNGRAGIRMVNGMSTTERVRTGLLELVEKKKESLEKDPE